MSKLTAEEIAGLANASPAFSSLLKKAAATFNEDVPATQIPPGGGDQSTGSGYPANAAPAGKVGPPAAPEEDPYAAVPMEGEEAAPPEGDTPEAVGARAAQAFLGPIMDGAMQGDPNAQNIVAQAAGSVAGSVADSYAKSQMAGGAGGAGMPPEMAPPAVTTPEEDMANQIVQEPAPAPVPPENGEAQPPAGGVNGEKDEEEEVDENGNPKKKKKPPFPPKK